MRLARVVVHRPERRLRLAPGGRVFRHRTVDGIAPNGTLHGAVASSLWMLLRDRPRRPRHQRRHAAVVVAMSLIASQQVRYGTLRLVRPC